MGPSSLARMVAREPAHACNSCGEAGFKRGAPWVRLSDARGIWPSARWEYYCNECRALQVLSGEDWEVFNLEDF